jgi:NAD-specific glutamate dehydrogenase
VAASRAGGIRWSDRREDFRTEVLGLMKAQMVKNAVIVPTGAKGGFVLKRAVADATPREGVACYREFISGLLDVTDNLVDGASSPADVVRYDADDPYLVVAADKGTATFSDIANEIAARTVLARRRVRLRRQRRATTTRRWASRRAARGRACAATRVPRPRRRPDA